MKVWQEMSWREKVGGGIGKWPQGGFEPGSPFKPIHGRVCCLRRWGWGNDRGLDLNPGPSEPFKLVHGRVCCLRQQLPRMNVFLISDGCLLWHPFKIILSWDKIIHSHSSNATVAVQNWHLLILTKLHSFFLSHIKKKHVSVRQTDIFHLPKYQNNKI